MMEAKILRTSIFILAFLIGLLRESVAQGQATRAVSKTPTQLPRLPAA